MVDFFPNAIDIFNFIYQKEFIWQAKHILIDIWIRSLDEIFNPLLNFIFFLLEVIVELIDKLFAFFQASYMSLSSAVSLRFNHLSSFQRLNHFHLKSSAFDFSFVYLRCSFIRSKNWLFFFWLRSNSHFFE